ncbi:peptidase inhibitor I78 [Phenylobacterium sp.]|uniref:peptidase inhibitor I78 n=1 Tax=Phenylobacterium sp. TaxID=1871053 RepID=UPI0035B31059
MNGWRAPACAIAVLVLAGCASEPPAPPPEPPAEPPQPPPPPPSPPPPPDLCGATAAQRFVGRPRTEIPVPVDVALQRVACTTCAITMDFNPKRLNFFFDAETGIVKEVKCG